MTILDRAELREAFGKFPTGVTVVTTVADDGSPVGFTANSFSSVSLDPPLLLVCPARSMSCFSIFETCRRFAVNVLAEGQQEISSTFAVYQGDRFSEISWRQDAAGQPLIDGAVGQFSCTTHQTVDAGDHIILIGAIDSVVSSERPSLGFFSGGYFSLGHERETRRSQPKSNSQGLRRSR
jgi:flavin reductase (DIM6/NTAB) family NADH-FMN oxidoreductase RutF